MVEGRPPWGLVTCRNARTNPRLAPNIPGHDGGDRRSRFFLSTREKMTVDAQRDARVGMSQDSTHSDDVESRPEHEAGICMPEPMKPALLKLQAHQERVPSSPRDVRVVGFGEKWVGSVADGSKNNCGDRVHDPYTNDATPPSLGLLLSTIRLHA